MLTQIAAKDNTPTCQKACPLGTGFGQFEQQLNGRLRSFVFLNIYKHIPASPILG
jgi:hypothetical protein